MDEKFVHSMEYPANTKAFVESMRQTQGKRQVFLRKFSELYLIMSQAIQRRMVRMHRLRIPPKWRCVDFCSPRRSYHPFMISRPSRCAIPVPRSPFLPRGHPCSIVLYCHLATHASRGLSSRQVLQMLYSPHPKVASNQPTRQTWRFRRLQTNSSVFVALMLPREQDCLQQRQLQRWALRLL